MKSFQNKKIFTFKSEKQGTKSLSIKALYDALFCNNDGRLVREIGLVRPPSTSVMQEFKNVCIGQFVVFMNYIKYPGGKKYIRIPVGFKSHLNNKELVRAKEEEEEQTHEERFIRGLLKTIRGAKKKRFVQSLPKLSELFLKTIGSRLKNSKFNSRLNSLYKKEVITFVENRNKRYKALNNPAEDNKDLIIRFGEEPKRRGKKTLEEEASRSRSALMLNKFKHVVNTSYNINFRNPNILLLQFMLYSFNYPLFGEDSSGKTVGTLRHFKGCYIGKVWGDGGPEIFMPKYSRTGRRLYIETIQRKIRDFEVSNNLRKKKKKKRRKRKKKKKKKKRVNREETLSLENNEVGDFMDIDVESTHGRTTQAEEEKHDDDEGVSEGGGGGDAGEDVMNISDEEANDEDEDEDEDEVVDMLTSEEFKEFVIKHGGDFDKLKEDICSTNSDVAKKVLKRKRGRGVTEEEEEEEEQQQQPPKKKRKKK
jgi:hypothetical protein